MSSTARIISNQLRAGRTQDGTNGTIAMGSWGSRQLTNLGDGLAFRVSGMMFKGIVEVKLNSHDLYDIHFIKAGKLKEASLGVFCDQLTAIIDNFVEGV